MAYETASRREPETINLEPEVPMTTLGDIALKFLIGHGLAGDLTHLSIAPNPLETVITATDIPRTYEAIIDVVNSADLLSHREEKRAARR